MLDFQKIRVAKIIAFISSHKFLVKILFLPFQKNLRTMLLFTLTVIITFSVNSLYGLIAGAKVLQFSAFANVFKSFFESFLQVVGLMIFAAKDFFREGC